MTHYRPQEVLGERARPRKCMVMQEGLDPTREVGKLVALGLLPLEESIYGELLHCSSASAEEIAVKLSLPRRLSRNCLRALEEKGIVARMPETIERYSALPPDIVADLLFARRQTELHKARAVMMDLHESIENERDGMRRREQVVEILSAEAAVKVYLQLIDSSQIEILCLDKLPKLATSNDRPSDALLSSLARGVRWRSIVDSEVVNLAGTLNRLHAMTPFGASFRVAPTLVFKLVIVDRRTAIVPLSPTKPNGPVLLVRASSLLDALCEMFEMYWHVAMPYLCSSDLERIDVAIKNDRSEDDLLALLASGLNDKSIEYELGLSRRTLTRRILGLMRRFGADTRFQAGWLAALAAHSHDGTGTSSADGQPRVTR
ncbi:MAG: helix-turn-helix domain-containing protein [Dokdonella sp.]